GGRVEIVLEAIDSHAQIRVRDTGKGLKPDFLPYIFDRFHQADSSTTKTNQGLGLGLSIVRHLVELHGGTVRAESPGEGQGTTMTLRLPLVSIPQELTPPSDVEPTVFTLPLNTSKDGVPSLEGLQILSVDDDVDTRELLKFVLEDYGAEVLTVGSAKEAISALTENLDKYDILISDIGMPEQDGYSLIQQVRSLDAEAGNIPAIALTAYASDKEVQRAIDAGFNKHIAKPVKPAQLALIIADLIAQKNALGFVSE
ncbi:MAG: response regulator, partial [Oscillatoriales cyanobacterium]